VYTRTVNIGRDVDLLKLPAHLAARLHDIHARTVEINQNQVSFTGALFGFGNRWDLLVPFGFGDLTIDANALQLSYRLSFRQLMIVTSVMVGIMAGVGCSMFRSWEGLVIFPFGWTWLVGGNLAIGLPRFKKFIDSAIETAPRLGR
jgi:hypothetical protein